MAATAAGSAAPAAAAVRRLTGGGGTRRRYAEHARGLSQHSAFSAAAATKIALRALYRRAHPDLFTRHPTQQRVNQCSLQELQAAVTESSTRGFSSSPRRRLRFYVHTDDDNGHDGDEGAARRRQGAPNGAVAAIEREHPELRVVEMQLGGGTPLMLSLQRLLSELGVMEERAAGDRRRESAGGAAGGEGEYERWKRHGGLSLADFLLSEHNSAAVRARDAAAKLSTEQSNADECLDAAQVLRLQLQRARGVELRYGDELSHAQRAAAARRLARVLDEVDERFSSGTVDLRHGQIVLEGKEGVRLGPRRGQHSAVEDSAGASAALSVLHLGCGASDRAWRDALLGDGFVEARRRHADVLAALDDAEQLAASSLGVRFVVAEGDLASHHAGEYLAFLQHLQRAAAGAATAAPNIDDEELMHTNLSLMVTHGGPTPRPAGGRDDQEEDVDNGVMRVALEGGGGGRSSYAEAAAEAVARVRARGGALARASARRAALRRRADESARVAERRLRARRIRCASDAGGMVGGAASVHTPDWGGEHVGAAQFASCCQRLAAHAPALRGALQGVMVVVDTRYELDEERGEIHVPFDYELGDVRGRRGAGAAPL